MHPPVLQNSPHGHVHLTGIAFGAREMRGSVGRVSDSALHKL